jgi:hypothetical protein
MNVGRVTALLATTSCLAAWALLAYVALGPTYTRCGDGPRGRLVCSPHSLLELHGVPPAVFVVAAAYGVAALGGLLVWRGYRDGRWLMAAAVVPLVGAGLVSSGLVLLMPLTGLMVLATITAFASPDQ